MELDVEPGSEQPGAGTEEVPEGEEGAEEGAPAEGDMEVEYEEDDEGLYADDEYGDVPTQTPARRGGRSAAPTPLRTPKTPFKTPRKSMAAKTPRTAFKSATKGASGDGEGEKKKKKKKSRKSQMALAALTDEQVALAALQSSQMLHLKLRKRYYAEALSFIRQLESAMETVGQLLGSTNKAEVLEAMEFFRVAHEYQFAGAEVCSHFPAKLLSADAPFDRQVSRGCCI